MDKENNTTATTDFTARELKFVRQEVSRADIRSLLRKVCAEHKCRAEITAGACGRVFRVALCRNHVDGGVVGDGNGPPTEASALRTMLGALAQGGWVDRLLEADLKAGSVKATNGHMAAVALVMRIESGGQ